MIKDFVSYQLVRNNAIMLARAIIDDHFIPSVMYVSLRGGAYIGNIISECYKLWSPHVKPVLYAAVVARSYTNNSQSNVHIDGWTYDPAALTAHDKVLLIDDIFDSGATINKLAQIILGQGVLANNLKIAVHDYKIRLYQQKKFEHSPNYWCRRIEIARPEDDNWLHYLSHELVGLTAKELRTYYAENKAIHHILSTSLVDGSLQESSTLPE